jgi:hypothetical protein
MDRFLRQRIILADVCLRIAELEVAKDPKHFSYYYVIDFASDALKTYRESAGYTPDHPKVRRAQALLELTKER